MFYDNFCRICEQKGVKPTNVVKVLGLSSGNMTNWKNGRTPKTDVALKLANYLSVSVEELLGYSEESSDELTEYLEELRTRSELRMLFSVAKGATKEDVEKVVEMFKIMKGEFNG